MDTFKVVSIDRWSVYPDRSRFWNFQRKNWFLCAVYMQDDPIKKCGETNIFRMYFMIFVIKKYRKTLRKIVKWSAMKLITMKNMVDLTVCGFMATIFLAWPVIKSKKSSFSTRRPSLIWSKIFYPNKILQNFWVLFFFISDCKMYLQQ